MVGGRDPPRGLKTLWLCPWTEDKTSGSRNHLCLCVICLILQPRSQSDTFIYFTIKSDNTLKIPVVLFRGNAFHFVLSCYFGIDQDPDSGTQAAGDQGRKEGTGPGVIPEARPLCSRQDKNILGLPWQSSG